MSAPIPVFGDRPKAAPTPKLRALVKFPGNIIGTTGIEVSKANGNVTIETDWTDFGSISAIPTAPTSYILTFDTATGVYVLVPSHLLGGAVAGIADAPNDGVQYGRQSGAWTATSTGGGIADAPSDGTQYGRKNAAWSVITSLTDAPSDGTQYARRNAAWTAVPPGISDAPSDNQAYGRKNASWTLVTPATLAAIAPAQTIYFPACDITGTTNSAPFIQAAVTAAEAAGGGVIILPATGTGKILINTSVIISKGGIHIKGFGFEEFKGYQGQFAASRGTTGTYIHTSASISPFVVRGSANGCKISDMAFTQTQPASAPGWTPTAYPPCIDHSVNDMPSFSSSGSLEVFNVVFAGVYRGIQAGTTGGSAGTSKFTGRDYYHDIKGTIFDVGILINAASDVVRIENLHFWPLLYEQATTDVYNYALNNAVGIYSFRNDNCMMTNIFLFGFRYGLRISGSVEGTTQGMQVVNLDCDATHVGILIDTVSVGSDQCALSVINYSHVGVDASAGPDFALWIAPSATRMAVTINNGNFANYASSAVFVQGDNNHLTLTNACALNYSQAGTAHLVTVGPTTTGTAAYLYGHFRVASTGSSPGIGNVPLVVDNSDGPASSWVSYVPTTILTGGATATTTGTYKVINHVTFINVTVSVTAGGRLTNVSLPNTAVGGSLLIGREVAVSGQVWQAYVSGTLMNTSRFDNDNPVSAGDVVVFSGSYQNA